MTAPFVMSTMTMFIFILGILTYASIYIYMEHDQPNNEPSNIQSIQSFNLEQSKLLPSRVLPAPPPPLEQQRQRQLRVQLEIDDDDDGGGDDDDGGDGDDNVDDDNVDDCDNDEQPNGNGNQLNTSGGDGLDHDVSEYLSDHVQFLAIKAKHRMEVVKRHATNWLNSIYFSLNRTVHCNHGNWLQTQIENIYRNLSTSRTTRTTTNNQTFPFQRIFLMNNCELLWNELPPNNNNNNNNGFNGQLLSIEPSFSMIEQIVDHETNNDQQQQQQHSNLCNLIETIDTFSNYQQEKTLNGNPLRQLCNNNRATITSNQWPSIFLVNVTVLLTSVDPLRAFIYNLDHIVQSNLIRQRIMARLTHANIILSVSNRLINLNRMNSDTSINNRINRFSFIQFTLSINNDEMEKEKENLFNRIEILDMRTIPIESIDYKLFNETINLILSSSTQSIETYIGTQVQRLLDRDELGLVGVNCHQSHLACLSIDDMKFIAHTSIQAANMKHFQLLYPVLAPDGSIYHLSELFDDLLIHMNRKIGRTHSQQDDEDNEIEIDIKSNEAIDYRTERLHSILSMIDFIQTPPLSTSTTTTTASSKSNSNCSTNIEKLSQLSHLTMKRPITIQLEPSFISDHFHYSSKSLVNYESLVLSIELAVSHCDVWIKVDDQILFQSGILNFTLGIGENTIIVSLVNGVKLLSTYTLTVYRQSREEQYSTKIRIGGRHEICSLTQDCSMVIYPNIPCGLQSTGTMVENDEIISSKWIQSLSSSSRKCTNGIEPGQWMLPCLDCSNESTCKWDRLQWIPYNCSYELINSDQTLSQCFHHKHILMIGDSTNRGILHYLIERMNHTLTDCDKTHDIKRYEIRSNDDGTLQTTFTFAYYPKFWLSTPNRPSFTEMLRKLLLISRREPLMSDGNDYGQNMIAIIGGVQWINRKHLFIISDEFRKFGLTKSKIFIKSYGSGFHQSVNGVHYVPLSEQRKLSQYNQQLIEQATQFKMNVVDTFNKTIALYRDFYPGKCACHFHNIVRNETLVDNHQTEHHYHQKYNYHVDGRLNRLYSEILLSLICK